MDMMHYSPAECRKMAELCRRHAEELDFDQDRSRWLRIAENWLVIARDTARENTVTPKSKTLWWELKHLPQDCKPH